MKNYEKKYKEALERAKRFMSIRGVSPEEDPFVVAKELCEEIFPELAETEDERIRKWLIDHIRTVAEYYIPNLDSRKIILAWLEKQKEPHYTKRNALFDKCVENCDPKVMKEVSDKVDEMLGKEQKPVEWSEEDEKMRWNLINAFTDKNNSKVDEFMGLRASKAEILDFLKSLRPSWKPSEEQMDRLVSIVAALRKDSCDDMADFLAEIYHGLEKL